jgi:PrcB C-terminal
MMITLPAIITVMALQAGGVETVVSDSHSNVEEFRHAVASKTAEWESLWRAHAGPGKPAPTIDFNQRTVVALFLGSRPTAGYAIEITGTRQEGKTLVVDWRETRPKPGMLLAQVLTSPALIASIPRFDGTIAFKKVDP